MEIRSIAGVSGERKILYWIGYEGNCDEIVREGDWFMVKKKGKLIAEVRVSVINEITYPNEDTDY